MAKTFWTRYRSIVLGIVALLLVAAAVLPSPSKSVGAFAYEVIRRCPDLQRNVPPDSFLVIGHRGAAAYAVENTIPSMAEAMKRGANALEIDLCMTRDSAIVVLHDWDPDDPIATARQGGLETDVAYKPVVPDEEHALYRPVHELTLAELREHYGYAKIDDDSLRRVDAEIPTLEEFLAWSAGASGLRAVYLDFKVPDDLAAMAPAVLARVEKILAASRPNYDVVYLVAAEKVYAAVEPLLPKGNITLDRQPPAGMIIDPCDYGSVAPALEHDNRYASTIIPVTSTFAPWTTARRIAECDVERSQGRVQVVVSTMNDPEKLECLLGLGVHGIITDKPDVLRRLVR